MNLPNLALSRGTVDRTTERRTDIAWLDKTWTDPRTRVLVVHHGKANVRFDPGESYLPGGRHGSARLELIEPADAPDGTRFLLGQDADGTAYYGVSAALGDNSKTRAMSLREIGAILDSRDAGLFTHAVALANWHDTHTHCPRCGTPTIPEPSGDSTRCPKDGTEHFPRTDPAVIMLVTDADDRCLLGRGAAWAERRYSILAGFVDPGESAEQAVEREVREETGIAVHEIEYLASQPWPIPRSLMLGFRAKAVNGAEPKVDGTELAEAFWISREDLISGLRNRELGIAAPVSIARHIIEYWYGAELPY